MTFEDLKKIIEGLSPEQLKLPVIWWGDGIGGEIGDVLVLEEPYVSVEGESFEPASGYDPEELEELEEDGLVEILPAGTPILVESEEDESDGLS